MAVLDFKEIPEAHIASGKQDTFELFARDFLAFLGFIIVSGPNRGADGGKDIMVKERRTGICGETNVQWLVSCKHKAHSGNSVTPADEPNIRDRVESNHCTGFIGFYSTLPSSGLNAMLVGLKTKIETEVFDSGNIETKLLASLDGTLLSKKYFPNSMKKWENADPSPATLFSDQNTLRCEYCGKSLIDNESMGIVVFWRKIVIANEACGYEDMYWCCKGACDSMLRVSRLAKGLVDRWADIQDILLPQAFLKFSIDQMNGLFEGWKFSDNTFEKMKEFWCTIFPYISRHPSAEQKERVSLLSHIPSFWGGLG